MVRHAEFVVIFVPESTLMIEFFVCIPRGRAEIVILVWASVETEPSANARRNVRSGVGILVLVLVWALVFVLELIRLGEICVFGFLCFFLLGFWTFPHDIRHPFVADFLGRHESF
jgi:hypothetical protein